MALIVRVVDDVRYGLREVDVEELRTLAAAWSFLNDGVTPSEVALRCMRDAE